MTAYQQKQAPELDLSTEVATRLNLVDREAPGLNLPDPYSAHKRHGDEDIPRLTKVKLKLNVSVLLIAHNQLMISSLPIFKKAQFFSLFLLPVFRKWQWR